MKPLQRPGADLSEVRDRKAEHIEIALDRSVQVGGSGFDRYLFEHQALPELDLAEIDTTANFLGYTLNAPLLISCMTGGTGDATRINRHLAQAAEATGSAIGVGSQRKAFEDPAHEASFQVRRWAPSVPVLANLGAVQLNYGFGPEECQRAVDMIEADALVLHLNPLQEALQPEGQGDFSDLLPKIARVVDQIDVPVVVKEIGCGLSARVANRLRDVGIKIFDTAGVGGTSWARIEARRAREVDLGERFADWGVPTTESIRALAALDGVFVIGSGGVRSGVDVAKAIALGADLAGLAQPFLEAANQSAEQTVASVESLTRELRIAMFCTGAATVEALRRVRLSRRGED